jgi:molybdopterin synthase sulfur carrier subunit
MAIFDTRGLLHRCRGRKDRARLEFLATREDSVEVRIRLGSGIAQFATAPVPRLELRDGARVDELYERLAVDHTALAPALRSALPVVAGEHAPREQALAHGDEVALLAPVAGG